MSKRTFGETLAAYMQDNVIKAKELSDHSGVTQSYISKLISGKFADPTFTKACAIIDALGITLDEFSKLQDAD